jgi:hypothetical protein
MQSDFLTAANKVHPSKEPDDTKLAVNLITEEFEEWKEELPFTQTGNLNDLKECIDLIYTAAQYMNNAVGPDKAAALFDEVHRHNMSKCVEGKLHYSPEGKVLKPVDFDKEAWRTQFLHVIGADLI